MDLSAGPEALDTQTPWREPDISAHEPGPAAIRRERRDHHPYGPRGTGAASTRRR